MFYCKPCGNEAGWPTWMLPDSNGRCEECGKSRACFDVAIKNLPPRKNAPPRKPETKSERTCEYKFEIKGYKSEADYNEGKPDTIETATVAADAYTKERKLRQTYPVVNLVGWVNINSKGWMPSQAGTFRQEEF